MSDLIERLEIQGADAFHKHYSLGMWKLCAEAAAALRVSKDALHKISLGSQDSGTTKESLGREARAAIARLEGKDEPPKI